MSTIFFFIFWEFCSMMGLRKEARNAVVGAGFIPPVTFRDEPAGCMVCGAMFIKKLPEYS